MLMWKGRSIPCVYVFIYQALKDGAENKFYISYDYAKKVLSRRFYRLPRQRSFHYLILKELEEFKLIKKVGGKNCMKFEFVGEDAEVLLRQYQSFLI